jgi:pilus assembly protein CpaB
VSTLSVKAPALHLRKRTIAIGMSLLLAAGATAALITYVRNVENRASAQAVSVPVFVAKLAIPANTPAEVAVANGAFESTMIPRRLLAAGVVSSLAALAGKVAAVDIMPGEQILASRFVSSLERPTLLPIPAGHQALTVAAEMANSVGGFVQPGDHVSVIAKIDIPSGSTTTTVTRYLVQDVSVLAVGQTIATTGSASSKTEKSAAANSSTNQNTVALTLAVSPSEAEKLAFAVLQGDVYFTLVPSNQKPVATTGRTGSTLFNR